MRDHKPLSVPESQALYDGYLGSPESGWAEKFHQYTPEDRRALRASLLDLSYPMQKGFEEFRQRWLVALDTVDRKARSVDLLLSQSACRRTLLASRPMQCYIASRTARDSKQEGRAGRLGT